MKFKRMIKEEKDIEEKFYTTNGVVVVRWLKSGGVWRSKLVRNFTSRFDDSITFSDSFTQQDIMDEMRSDYGGSWRNIDYAKKDVKESRKRVIKEFVSPHENNYTYILNIAESGAIDELEQKYSDQKLIVMAHTLLSIDDYLDSKGIDLDEKFDYYFPIDYAEDFIKYYNDYIEYAVKLGWTKRMIKEDKTRSLNESLRYDNDLHDEIVNYLQGVKKGYGWVTVFDVVMQMDADQDRVMEVLANLQDADMIIINSINNAKENYNLQDIHELTDELDDEDKIVITL